MFTTQVGTGIKRADERDPHIQSVREKIESRCVRPLSHADINVHHNPFMIVCRSFSNKATMDDLTHALFERLMGNDASIQVLMN